MSSTVATESLRKPELEEGGYDAEIIKVAGRDGVKTQYGIKDLVIVTFDVEGVEVNRRYSKNLRQGTALRELVDTLVDGDLQKDEFGRVTFDVADLIGTRCHVVIKYNKSDNGDVWENIDGVTKARKPSTLLD